MSDKDLSNDEIITILSKIVIQKGLVESSSLTKISPGHLWNIINNSHVYKLTDRMKKRVKESGLLV